MSYTPISEILVAAYAVQEAAESVQDTQPNSVPATILVAGSSLLMVGTEIVARLDRVIELMEGMRPATKT